MTIVLSLSGGIDSTVLLAYAKSKGHEVDCVSFGYGTKHNPYERTASHQVAKHYGIDRHYMNLSAVFLYTNSALLGTEPIPEAHYDDESQKATIVPGRNLIFASVLASLAQSLYPEGAEVWIGAHLGDAKIYPDCREIWVYKTKGAIRVQSEGKIQLEAPLIQLRLDKAGVVKLGLELNVPFELTRTCYKGEDIACGKCGACQERLEAFDKNGARDPLSYRN